MDSAERIDLIVARVREEGEASVIELAELTGHSEMTIRRDLDQLAGQGVVRRVRGGAVSLVPRGEEAPYALRERQAVEAKRRIAAAVAGLVGDGQALVLDSGTTATHIARELAGRAITVMPLSLQAAQVLGGSGDTRVLMPGGEVRPGELSMTGPLAEASLAAVRFDTAVFSCCGLSVADGCTVHDLGEVAVKRVAMRASRRVVMVADSTKLGRVTMGYLGPVGEIDTLVTDADIPDDSTAEIEAAGVTVVRA